MRAQKITDRALTIDQVAERLSVNPLTIRRKISAGELSAIKVGRVFRIFESDLHAFTQTHRAVCHE